MSIKRLFLASFGVLALGAAAALGQSSVISAFNYANSQGWHVGGVLEILPTGTFRIGTGTKTAAATAGAATLNNLSGSVTSEALTTAAGSNYTLTITDPAIAATDAVMASVALGTATAGSVEILTVTPGAGALTIVVRNPTGGAALNGTVVVSFVDFKA